MQLPVIIKEYLLKSSFHGLHFLVEKDLHWSEKLFWFICVLASWSGSVYLMMSALDVAYYNPITLTVDSAYLDWKSRYPAIVICEYKNKKVLNEAKRIFSNDTQHFQRKLENLEQLVFFQGTITESSIFYYPGNMSYYRNLRSSCEEIFNNCSWNGNNFNCCDEFLQTETVFGPCFAANSIHTNRTNDDLKMTMDKDFGHLSIGFKNPDVSIFGVSNQELPTYTTQTIVKAAVNNYYEVFLSLTETISDEAIRDIEIERRKCRFPDENNLNVANKYSYETCRLQCQKDVQLALYNCTHHLMPYAKADEICDDKQIIKLAKDFRKWSQESAINCNCELSCRVNDVSFIADIKSDLDINDRKSGTLTRVLITCAPSHHKFIRERSKTTLDMIVSLGGTAGLFVGASILSILEIIYFFTVRAINARIIESKPKQRKKLKNKVFLPFVN